MPRHRSLPITALAALFFTAPILAAQGSPPVEVELHWSPVPGLFPRGAQMALISGDPFKAVTRCRPTFTAPTSTWR